MSRIALALVAAALLTLPLVAHADAQDEAVRRIALQLQCPVCEGETVADSPSGLANDMRNVIRQKVAGGESDQQILDEFVASYGDGILTEPPKRGISLGVWVGPLIGIVLGCMLLVTVLRTWRRAAAPPTVSTPEPDVAAELTRFREEFGR
jgi:cytochrome c-type biogenesis protein CcmH